MAHKELFRRRGNNHNYIFFALIEMVLRATDSCITINSAGKLGQGVGSTNLKKFDFRIIKDLNYVV